MTIKGKEMRYKWNRPHDWLAEKVKNWSREKLEERYLKSADLARGYFLRTDIHDEMEEDGYFKLVETTPEDDD